MLWKLMGSHLWLGISPRGQRHSMRLSFKTLCGHVWACDISWRWIETWQDAKITFNLCVRWKRHHSGSFRCARCWVKDPLQQSFISLYHPASKAPSRKKMKYKHSICSFEINKPSKPPVTALSFSQKHKRERWRPSTPSSLFRQSPADFEVSFNP